MEQESFVLSGLHEGFLGIAVLNAEPLWSLQLLHSEPTVLQAVFGTGEMDLTIFVRCEDAQVPILTIRGVVGSVPDLEAHIFEPVSSDATFLNNGDSRGFVVVEIHVAVTVGIEGRQLRLSIQQVGGGDRLFSDFNDGGQQILHGGGAVRPSCHLSDAVAICIFDQERGARYRLGGVVCIKFPDGEVRTDLVFHYQLTGLAGEELHMVLARIKNMGRNGGCFLDGQHTQIHIADLNDSAAVRYAVEVTGAILHIGDPERNTLQRGPVCRQLDDPQGGFDRIGEHMLSILVGVQMDDALGLVNDIALTGLLSDDIRANGEHGQDNGAVGRSYKLFRTIASINCFDLEYRPGDALRGVV